MGPLRRLLFLLAGAWLASPAWAAELAFHLEDTFAEKGPGRGELRSPVDVALTPGGELVVLDEDRGALVFFATSGRWLRTVEGIAAGPEGLELRRPSAVAVDRDGRLWVVDNGNHRVLILDGSGKVLQVVGSLGTQPGRFRHPTDLTFDDDGRAYVADAGNERIEVFRPDGSFLAAWERRTGGRRDYLSNPKTLAYTDQGKGGIWVANQGSARLERFNLDGEWEESLDLSNVASEAFFLERIEIEQAFYRMFLVDSAQGRVLVVSKRGELVAELRGPEGQRLRPKGLAVTRPLDVFVTDSKKPRVLWYKKD